MAKKFLKPYEAVEVIWQDARSINGWKGFDEIEEWRRDFGNRTIHSLGYVLSDSKDGLVLTMSRDEHEGSVGMALSVIEIPRQMIIRIHMVKRRPRS